jgi:hypothetical protein
LTPAARMYEAGHGVGEGETVSVRADEGRNAEKRRQKLRGCSRNSAAVIPASNLITQSRRCLEEIKPEKSWKTCSYGQPRRSGDVSLTITAAATNSTTG